MGPQSGRSGAWERAVRPFRCVAWAGFGCPCRQDAPPERPEGAPREARDAAAGYRGWAVRRSIPSRLLFIAETLLLTLLVVVGIQTFVAQPYRVERESMLETLQEGEMVLVDKLTPRLGSVARGEIIVFTPPAREGDDGTPFIKRVIGLPGETVQLVDGAVVINGVPLDESAYIYHDQPTLPTDTILRWEVPEGALFVLGDHREDSTDSRMGWLGMVPLDAVIGRAVARYWPLESAAVLAAPAYPELSRTAAAGMAQAGPDTQVSIARP
jgi:signal peptidase I